MRMVDCAKARWTVEAFGEMEAAPHIVRGKVFKACVPGCVHNDLVRAGVIGHPNIGFNEESSQWIGRTDWRFQCQVEADENLLSHERVDLVLDGVDTIGAIDINGQRVGEPMNMHHAHRFDVKPMLRAGANDLTIALRGPVTYVEDQAKRLGERPVNGDWTPYSYIRKMASNFQWDWGPKVATCGIWRAARLEAWSVARIAGVRPIIETADATKAIVRVVVDVELAEIGHAGFAVSAELRGAQGLVARGESECVKGERPTLTLEIAHPALWHPRGHGEQPLHALDVQLLRNGTTIDKWSKRIGLRQARLIAALDQHGASFAIEVNGAPIFCKGANWIPEGLFPADQTPGRIRERVRQAADANMNMLRVWGGGTYEQDAFYDACDELGIMVWQDFMFACATYPEDDPYPQLIEREAREAVTRLSHHPSIVLWCGGNEDILGYESWGWKERMRRDQKWGERYFLDILPRVVAELDPSRPYWPDSPYSGARHIHPNDPDRGDRHTWDAKVEEYRNIMPRFCSEFGHQSPPCWATMRETWGEDQLRLDSRAMVHRQRATGGNDVWFGDRVMGGRFRQPADFDEWLYLAHLLQARAISIGIEWLRSNQPHCMGALFWQFNDAWAGHSWSCIDSAGRKKPLWHAARRSFAPRLLTIQPLDGELCVCAVNETPLEWRAQLRVRRVNMRGETLAEHAAAFHVQPREAWRSAAIADRVGAVQDEREEFIVVETDDPDVERAFWCHRQDVISLLPAVIVRAESMRLNKHDIALTLRADSFVRDAVIAVDRVDPHAEISDNLISMLPGEKRTLRIRTTVDVPASAWIAPPVFRCANEFTGLRDRA